MHGPRIILGPISRSPAVSYSILRTIPAVSSQFVITPLFISQRLHPSVIHQSASSKTLTRPQFASVSDCAIRSTR